MAKLTLNLVEGGKLSLETKETYIEDDKSLGPTGNFIQILYQSKGQKERKLGLLTRKEFRVLHSFLDSIIKALPGPQDEWMRSFMPVMQQLLGKIYGKEEGQPPNLE